KNLKYQKRSAPPAASDTNFYKQSASNRRNSSMPAPIQKPLKERIIHLLALKPYRKPELLLWLERERAGTKDKAELGAVLEEVAKVNPKDSSYLLKEDFYKHVQRDWPGYIEEEKQLIRRLLSRNVRFLWTHGKDWQRKDKNLLTKGYTTNDQRGLQAAIGQHHGPCIYAFVTVFAPVSQPSRVLAVFCGLVTQKQLKQSERSPDAH
ncbi:hypothetical protein GOODEAATRI_004030, partial [Goodea atripinnis]